MMIGGGREAGWRDKEAEGMKGWNQDLLAYIQVCVCVCFFVPGGLGSSACTQTRQKPRSTFTLLFFFFLLLLFLFCPPTHPPTIFSHLPLFPCISFHNKQEVHEYMEGYSEGSDGGVG